MSDNPTDREFDLLLKSLDRATKANEDNQARLFRSAVAFIAAILAAGGRIFFSAEHIYIH